MSERIIASEELDFIEVVSPGYNHTDHLDVGTFNTHYTDYDPVIAGPFPYCSPTEICRCCERAKPANEQACSKTNLKFIPFLVIIGTLLLTILNVIIFLRWAQNAIAPHPMMTFMGV